MSDAPQYQASRTTMVEIAEVVQPFISPALIRLRYLYPNARFAVVDKNIEVHADPEADMSLLYREVLYAVYREKIYAETLGMRRALIEAVMRR